MGTWMGGWWVEGGGIESVIGLTPTSPPPPPRPEKSTQFEMDFGVVRHTESFGEENERDRLKLWPLKARTCLSL